MLGITPDATTNEINRAYTKRKYEFRLDDAMRAKVEQAHSAIMMSALKSRMENKGKVSKDILYADQEPLFPWKPKRWDATPQVMLILFAIHAFLAVSAFQSPDLSKMVGAMLVGVAGNVMKQNAIYPPAAEEEPVIDEEEEGRDRSALAAPNRPGAGGGGAGGSASRNAAGKNFLRGGLLGLLATLIGLFFTTTPETLVQIFKFELPELVSTNPGILIGIKVAGVCLCNFIMTAFYY